MAEYIVVHGIRIAKDFVPENFGRLTTIGPAFFVRNGGNATTKRQVCACSCGKICIVYVSSFHCGKVGSCGCIRVEGVAKRTTRHGESGKDKRSKEYRAWLAMMERCYGEQHIHYADYGGRGINVCDRWREPNGVGYINYLSDMGRKPTTNHSMDRIDPNKGYSPDNCRWATPTEQNRNTRTNRLITAFGKTQCLAAWAEEFNISRGTIASRIKQGCSIEDAISRPSGVKKKKPSQQTQQPHPK